MIERSAPRTPANARQDAAEQVPWDAAEQVPWDAAEQVPWDAAEHVPWDAAKQVPWDDKAAAASRLAPPFAAHRGAAHAARSIAQSFALNTLWLFAYVLDLIKKMSNPLPFTDPSWALPATNVQLFLYDATSEPHAQPPQTPSRLVLGRESVGRELYRRHTAGQTRGRDARLASGG